MSKNSAKQNARQIDEWREWVFRTYRRKPIKTNPKFGKRK
jgi:hypothetical protein